MVLFNKIHLTPGNVIGAIGVVGGFIVGHIDAINSLVPAWAATISTIGGLLTIFSHNALLHEPKSDVIQAQVANNPAAAGVINTAVNTATKTAQSVQ